MLKKRSFYVTTIVVGILLFSGALFVRSVELKAVSGIMIGLGAGLIGMGIANFIMKSYELKDPSFARKNEIDLKDERNILIRNKAKAKAADIIQWFIIGLGFATILVNFPIWVTLVVVGIYVLYYIIYLYFMIKYQKEM